MISNEVVKHGRKCPDCGEVADKDFASCMGCGHDFTAKDPVCGFDKDGLIVEIDGAPCKPTKDLPNSAASAAPGPATPVAVSPAPGPDATATAPVLPAPPAATVEPVAVTKRVSIDIVVDESPRETRPAPGTADYNDPPKVDAVSIDLSEPLFTIGGLNSFDLPAKVFHLLTGDQAVSRTHGKFYRMPDGGYQVENLSKGCKIWIRQLKKEVEVGEKVTLEDGMELEIGDWYTITVTVHPV